MNGREHRVTERTPAEMRRDERERLHPPRLAHTVCFGETRESTISVGRAIYSVPHELPGERVWARSHDGERGPREVARHP